MVTSRPAAASTDSTITMWFAIAFAGFVPLWRISTTSPGRTRSRSMEPSSQVRIAPRCWWYSLTSHQRPSAQIDNGVRSSLTFAV